MKLDIGFSSEKVPKPFQTSLRVSDHHINGLFGWAVTVKKATMDHEL
jgi:hypothetical protein